ncbi:MAG: pentapeptide repeat-containing protein [Sodalis sp. (in: enterobacteria)]|uniref:pentapeptide repeat-containing protein n=1 Tax=Sodalis sp. (in: enterobacteria) TaxID=1898979 RepID=UPI0039E2900D
MIAINMFINNTLTFACAAGTGSAHAVKDAITPSGIFQHILDILTFGGIRRGKENVYTIMMDRMAEALDGTDITEPKDITLHDVMGCEVSFKLPPMGSDETKVTVEVREGGHLIGHDIDIQAYHKVCRTLLLRKELQLAQNPVILTEKGKMNLTGVNLAQANLVGIDLSDADLSHANLIRANLAGANLEGADLTGARLIRANLSGTDLTSANLNEADLNRADLIEADLCNVTLAEADLTNANLTSAELVSANLTEANFFRARLNDADLTRVNLSYANLVQANLTGAELIDADLTFAKLNGSHLTDADFTGVNLSFADLNVSAPWRTS